MEDLVKAVVGNKDDRSKGREKRILDFLNKEFGDEKYYAHLCTVIEVNAMKKEVKTQLQTYSNLDLQAYDQAKILLNAMGSQTDMALKQRMGVSTRQDDKQEHDKMVG